jgi:hypothetical protein
MSDGIMNAISYVLLATWSTMSMSAHVPGPFAAASASSPIKKSRSSVPLFIDRCPDPAPPVRYEGLLATAGRPDPELAAPPPAAFVAIAVGKTKDGESLPANPVYCSFSKLLIATIQSANLVSRTRCRCRILAVALEYQAGDARQQL